MQKVMGSCGGAGAEEFGPRGPCARAERRSFTDLLHRQELLLQLPDSFFGGGGQSPMSQPWMLPQSSDPAMWSKWQRVENTRKSADMKPDGHGYGSKYMPAGTGSSMTLNPTDICSRA
uniref:Uncharacterized protein n=1 Tax=Setaria viridis TaxID=4556 RepID=A0A4V6D4F1_SETVI|nr:hypothetical protein SEVIR_7G229350v2 [Setaria viridis]